MNRREFVSFLGLLAAGAAAMPEQIAAYTRYYDLNSPQYDNGLVAVDEIFASGLAARSMPLSFDVFRGGELALALGINAYGGVVRWLAAPDQKIVTRSADFKWWIKSRFSQDMDDLDNRFHECITGHISYIDQDGFRITRPLIRAVSSLVV